MRKIIISLLFIVGFTSTINAQKARNTVVTIVANQFYINGKPTYEGRYWKGHQIEGLLFNSRMVQGIFDDLNPKTRDNFIYPDTKTWDPERNTNEFIAHMQDWKNHGLLAFTINLQGGSPLGYGNNGWINSTFDEKGKLRKPYVKRLEKILDKADQLGMVVILGYFYFGQDQFLNDEKAVIKATNNITDWILKKKYTNILVEINNEADINYDHDILKAPNVNQLISLVKKKEKGGRHLLVSTSYSGGKLPESNVVSIADYILLHGNGVKEPSKISSLVEETKKVPGYKNQPIVYNEDDHFEFDKEENNFINAIKSYSSWGYFDYRMKDEGFENGFQSVPVDWGITSPRKKAFFEKLKEITGY